MNDLATPLLSDPRLILELAQGLEDPDVIASRFNLSVPQWEALKIDPAFTSQVEARKAELKREGYTFRAKCALAGEDLLPDIYIAAKRPDASFTTKMEAAKFFAKMGGLEPKEDKNAVLGAGFSVIIDIGNGEIKIGAQIKEKAIPDSLDDPPIQAAEFQFTPQDLTNLPREISP